MQRKRIGVYLSCEPHAGGSYQYEQFIFEASEALHDEHDIIGIAMTASWGDVLAKSKCKEKYYIKGLMSTQELSKAIDGLKCDIVVCATQVGLAAILKTPVISIIHDLMHRYEKGFPEVSAEGEYETRERFYKRICDYSAGIFVDSELGKEHVLGAYGDYFRSKIYVQPFRVPSYLYDLPEAKKQDGEKYFFYPAQFWQHKNHSNLLLAIRKLADDGLPVKLVLVGAEKNGSIGVKRLIELLQLNDLVKCLGYVSNEEIGGLFTNARAMIMPTFCGPTNIPPLEAMFLGCPVAVSDVYAMPWQVGNAALLFDPKSVDSISRAMKKLWQDDKLCEILAVRGKERSKLFSREAFNQCFANNLYNVFQRLKEITKINERS